MGAPKYPKNLVDRACKITGKASRTIRRNKNLNPEHADRHIGSHNHLVHIT
jgi:hypothetical protein